MATVNCKTCGEEVKFDEAKLPKQVVSFSCPSCKAKITFDNRVKGQRMTVSNITLKHMKQEELADIDQLIKKEKGVGPRAGLFIENGKLAPLITAGLEELGYVVDETISDENKMIDYVRKETPALLFVEKAKIDGPPSQLVNKLLAVSPNIRRQIFVTLMAENVKSNDGNAAFLFNVNCLISTEDLDHFHHILHEYLAEYQKLYHHFFRIREEKKLV